MTRRGLAVIGAFLCSTLATSAHATEVIRLEPGPDLHERFQTAAILARPDTIIELPAGRFELQDEIVLRNSHLTVRGQGMDKTILSFKNQVNGGQGILATGDTLTFEDFAIEDTPGDGLKVAGADGVVMRRIRVEWTRGPNPSNGSYALYPVQSKNILVEDCIARGASDAGVYVGQSEKIIVRRNLAELNVAGIEIENSHYADVYDNYSTHNTGGVLVFDLPDLPVKDGGHTRVFNNRIIDNNTKNFAPKGNIVGNVPAGTGMMVMANRDVEIFKNNIRGHTLAGVAIVSYLVTEIPFTDKKYNPIPRRVFIHDNYIEKSKHSHTDWGSRLDLVVHALYFVQAKPLSEVLYDGIGETFTGGRALPPEDAICVAGNTRPQGKAARFADLQLANKRWWLPFPGGPILIDQKAHSCTHEPIAEVVLDEPKPVPPQLPQLPPEAIELLCKAPGSGPNWPALLLADCPNLSSYRLFADATDPTRDAIDGIPYDLTTPLFSDYATKHRFAFLPPSTKAQYEADEHFRFPVGAVLAKTFGFGTPERVVETRLLVHRQGGWVGLPYIWRENRSDADLALGGGATQVSFVNAGGKRIDTRYAIPSANECAACHGGPWGVMPIGPKARLLNKDYEYAGGHTMNQLAAWTQAGVLEGAPDDPTQAPRLPQWDKVADGTLERRARAYLEVNCAHCHNPNGLARNTGLFLNASVTEPAQLGICKPPVAAGIGAGNNLFDVVPGKPDKSILVYRMGSNHAKIKMPQIGRSVVHEEGVALISTWIKQLPRASCSGRRGD